MRTICDEPRLCQRTIDHVYRMFADASSFLWDTDGVSCGSVDANDMLEADLENDCVLEAHISGLFRWLQDYEGHVDWVNLKMVESFDVDEWNQRGYSLAQMIARLLPDNYDLWYDYAFEDEKNRSKHPLLVQTER